jgi:hypothetical protein
MQLIVLFIFCPLSLPGSISLSSNIHPVPEGKNAALQAMNTWLNNNYWFNYSREWVVWQGGDQVRLSVGRCRGTAETSGTSAVFLMFTSCHLSGVPGAV